MRTWKRSLAIALGLTAVTASPASAVTVTLQPSSQDAFIMQNKPNRIAGAGPNNTRVRVQGSPPGTQVWRGLVQFDLSPIPTGAIVSSAILTLYAGSSSSPPLIHGLHRITTSWLQSAVKWNNQPPFLASPSATTSVSGGQGPRAFDVSADVQNFVNVCAADHGWLIRNQTETGPGTNNDDVNYVAKEDTHVSQLANRPKLTITYTPPPCMEDADCADASACTVNERCVAGDCVVDALDCDDHDPCSDDICDCTIGCINAPICNDGFTCTTDICDPDTLECTHTFSNAVCNTDCASGVCVADPDSLTIDPITGCNVTSTQPDGTGCTTDGNDCTNDQCQTGACVHPAKPDGTTCVDTSLCTTGDQCASGQCGGSTVTCTPLDQCHVAGECNPMTGVCSDPPKAAGESCSDGSACTQVDQCDGGGTCVGGTPITCAASDQCHDAGVCDAMTGICSDPPKTAGAPCDDGDACTQTDACNGGGACVGGNPVICTPSDQCHLAGTCDTQTGVCSDPAAPDATPCSDGNECTLSDVCINGACVSGSSITCGNMTVEAGCGEDCDNGGAGDCDAECHFICGPAPAAGCRAPVVSAKAKLVIKDKTPDKQDRLNWKWLKGLATNKANFGTPLTSTGYTLCVWDESANAQPILRAEIPAGGTCGTKPCWKETATGFKYKDKALDPDGIQVVVLKSGPGGKAKIILKGKADNLPLPTLPLSPTVTVQLKNDAICWEAVYGTATKNDAAQFKAKAN